MPISFDGEDVTDITIDGESVQEVTMDGDVVWSVGSIIDNYEDGDIAEYTLDGNGSSGDRSATAQQTTVFEGSYSVEVENQSNNNTALISTSGLDVYPSQGDVFDAHIRGSTTDDSWWTRFGTQSESVGAFGYAVAVNRGDGLELGKFDSGGYTTLASTTATFNASEWYRVEVDWQSDGSIAVAVYDNPGGSESQVASVSSTDTDYSSGGVGWRLQSSGNTTQLYGDLKQIQ